MKEARTRRKEGASRASRLPSRENETQQRSIVLVGWSELTANRLDEEPKPIYFVAKSQHKEATDLSGMNEKNSRVANKGSYCRS